LKATKFIVGAGALLGIVGTFLDWATVELEGPAAGLGAAVPTSGMDNGGPIFIFLLALPLVAAIVGLIKRFGRGMGVLALVGGLLASLLALVKYADISDAGAEIARQSMGSMSVAGGYWVMFVGCSITAIGGLIALVKPEPKPATPPGAAVMAAAVR
jgi:hypothetical protein